MVKGRRPERLAAATVMAAFVATHFATPVEIEGWRAGVAAVDASAFVLLLVLSTRFDRWWLIGAAAVQLVTVMTHVVGLVEPDLLLRTNVLIRWIMGVALLGLTTVGPFEARRLLATDARS
jgi:hypothetical protein